MTDDNDEPQHKHLQRTTVSVHQIVENIMQVCKYTEDRGWYVYSYSAFTIQDSGKMAFEVILRPPYNSQFDADWEPKDNISIKESCTSEVDLHACMLRFVMRVRDHPSLIDYVRGRFRQRLVDMADEGERLGFALEYVEVLRATSIKLATNALTKHDE